MSYLMWDVGFVLATVGSIYAALRVWRLHRSSLQCSCGDCVDCALRIW